MCVRYLEQPTYLLIISMTFHHQTRLNTHVHYESVLLSSQSVFIANLLFYAYGIWYLFMPHTSMKFVFFFISSDCSLNGIEYLEWAVWPKICVLYVLYTQCGRVNNNYRFRFRDHYIKHSLLHICKSSHCSPVL